VLECLLEDAHTHARLVGRDREEPGAERAENLQRANVGRCFDRDEIAWLEQGTSDEIESLL